MEYAIDNTKCLASRIFISLMILNQLFIYDIIMTAFFDAIIQL